LITSTSPPASSSASSTARSCSVRGKSLPVALDEQLADQDYVNPETGFVLGQDDDQLIKGLIERAGSDFAPTKAAQYWKP
jgi:hypothetical protein